MKWDDGSRPSSTAGGLTWLEPITGKMQMANTVAKNEYFQITCIVIIINDMKIVILSYREEHTYLFWRLV